MYHNTEEQCKICGATDLCFENNMRNLTNIDPTLDSLKTWTLMGSYWLKSIILELKDYRGVMCHETEGWCNI